MNFNNIISQYPTLDPEVLYYPKCKEYYIVTNISQFDHFLTNEEASENTVFYNGSNNEKYHIVETRFLRAFSQLFDHYELYEYQYKDSEKIEVSLLKDEEFFLNKIVDGLREIKEFSFLIPALSLIVLIDFDLEIVVYSTNIDNVKSLYDKFFRKVGFNLLLS